MKILFKFKNHLRFCIIVSVIAFLFFLSSDIFCQTIVPVGTISGTWTKGGSPYLIIGQVEVAYGESLIIMPGVEVKFNEGAE